MVLIRAIAAEPNTIVCPPQISLRQNNIDVERRKIAARIRDDSRGSRHGTMSLPNNTEVKAGFAREVYAIFGVIEVIMGVNDSGCYECVRQALSRPVEVPDDRIVGKICFLSELKMKAILALGEVHSVISPVAPRIILI